ncbi:ribonuclease H domain protein [Natronomonas pharaonis DSM 2160]|uniref:Ribonuclease H domain protein n=1 Tax=Natronomonas pharaonis (strain ATCC 35678 / DSM 2160 / CIP 103997 / JCM 8858 / NBRC 14720 / NCIMB 2260 / Gabara) TaxID=348780 RepID=A0A1U7EZE0_NATPD|nr:ribonuclease H-like domain-containing protein [Natronomonas pharaonis]CAI50648.1 ribonuclease H domain protein [Natronomonas pharaonis DSM 2160]
MRLENTYIAVDGVGETTERELWASGARTWSEFDPSLCGPTTADRIESFIEQARPRLDADDSAFFDRQLPSSERWRLYENFRDEACFFDIETTGLDQMRDTVTCVSIHQGGETETLVRGDDLTQGNLEALLDGPLLISFNGARFDVPFLETAFDIDIEAPHLDLMYPCKRVGLTGGLKAIEPEVGVERDRPDLSGKDAVRLWRDHERGVDGALETLISYNREDTVNLKTVADSAVERLDRKLLP